MKEVLNSQFDPKESKISILDFWADWCTPCKVQMPIFEKVSNEIDQVSFYKANVNNNPHLAHQHGITGLPTIIIFKDGVEFQRLNGVQNELKLKENIAKVLID